MSVTSDKNRFFQTSTSLENDRRRAAKSSNKLGDLIPVGSKILDLLSDPTSHDHVFVAESAGLARRVQLSVRHLQPDHLLWIPHLLTLPLNPCA